MSVVPDPEAAVEPLVDRALATPAPVPFPAPTPVSVPAAAPEPAATSPTGHVATESVATGCIATGGCECHTSLASLRGRGQADFEIEFFERILHRAGDFPEVLSALAERLCEKGWYQRAVVLDERLALLRPRDPAAHYNHACTLARLGRSDEALAALRSAIQRGFDDAEFLTSDRDLVSLHARPEFQRLVERLACAAR